MRTLVVAALVGLGLLGLGREMGAGFSGAGILFWDISSLNSALADAGYPRLEGSPILYGGLGLGGREIRLGGGGFGGAVSVRVEERSASLSLGFGGFVVEIPAMDSESFVFAVGILAGGGGAELLLRSRTYTSFGDAVAGPSDLYLSRGFWAILPYVAAEFWPGEWLGIRIMAGNLIAFSEGWRGDGNEFPGPPETFGGPFLGFLAVFGGRAPD